MRRSSPRKKAKFRNQASSIKTSPVPKQEEATNDLETYSPGKISLPVINWLDRPDPWKK